MNPQRQGGYVLILTLLFLMLIAFSLMGLARKSLGSALEAKEASEDLQRRWGVMSLRYVMEESLPQQLERAFAEYAEEATESESWRTRRWTGERRARTEGPPREIEAQITLGEIEFLIRFADENAKLSVNGLAAAWPAEDVGRNRRGRSASGRRVRRGEPHATSRRNAGTPARPVHPLGAAL